MGNDEGFFIRVELGSRRLSAGGILAYVSNRRTDRWDKPRIIFA